MKKLTIAILMFLSIVSFGQKTKTPPCYTDEVLQELLKKDPSLKDRMDKMNEEIINFGNNYKKTATNKVAQTNFTIPVVVYVVHSNQPLGTGSNISDAQVQSQLVALNTYFAGSGLNFCLATKAGSQTLLQAGYNLPTATSTTPGIIHVNNPTIANNQTTQTSQSDLINGTSGSILQDRFLRIWVVESINGINSNIGGYSYFPNSNRYLDGIVMNYKYFGDNTNNFSYGLASNYQQGKILVH